MSDYVQSLGMDTSDLHRGTNESISDLERFSGSLVEFSEYLTRTSDRLEGLNLKVTDFNSAGDKFVGTIKGTADGFELVSVSTTKSVEQLGLSTLAIAENSEALSVRLATIRQLAPIQEAMILEDQRVSEQLALETDLVRRLNAEKQAAAAFKQTFDTSNAAVEQQRSINDELDRSRKTEADMLVIEKRLNEERQAATAFKQTFDTSNAAVEQQRIVNDELDRSRKTEADMVVLANRLADETKAKADFERTFSTANAVAETHRELEEVELVNAAWSEQRELLEELTVAAQRRNEANSVIQPLVSAGIASNPAAAEATIQEMQRVRNAAAQIQELVERGLVSALRVGEIAASVEARSTEVFVGAERRVASYYTNLQSATENLGSDFRKLEDGANNVTLSWESMIRILQTQVLHQVLFQVVGDLKDAVTHAEEFEIRISEIRTISQENQLSFNQWSQAVENLSNQFGNPAMDVAEGVYQTISNQVASGADSFNFMTSALKFSQVTLASTKDSVNLIAAALNSFHLETDQADHVAAVFFNTITQGRLRAEDLANIFGRVGGISHALGLSFEETNAAISALTVTGTPANEAMTLLNNVMSHLINPTGEMKKILEGWGTPTGEAAVATFGFAGVLNKLQEATHGSAGELAEASKDIRAIRGDLGLTGEGLITFQKNLEAIRDTKKIDIAEKISVESAGKQFEIQLNQIKNFFLNDFGVGILNGMQTLTSSTDQYGKVTNNLVRDIEELGKVGAAALAGFGAYYLGLTEIAVGTVTATADTGAFVVGLYSEMSALGATKNALLLASEGAEAFGVALLANPVTWVVAGIAALTYAFTDYAESRAEMQQRLDSIDQRAEASAIELTKITVDEINEQTEARLQGLKNYEQNLLASNAELNKEITKQAKDIEDIYHTMGENLKLEFKGIEDGINGLINTANHAAEQAKKIAEDAARQRAEEQAGEDKRDFQVKVDTAGPEQQIDLLVNKSKELNNLAVAKLEIQDPDTSKLEENQVVATKARAEAAEYLLTVIEKVGKAQKEAQKGEQEIADANTALAAKKRSDLEADQNAATKRQEQEAKDALKSPAHRPDRTVEHLEQTRASEDRLTSESKAEEHIAELQKTLDANNAIVASAAKYGDLQALSTKLLQEHSAALLLEQAYADKLHDSNAKDGEQDRTNLERMKKDLADIEKAKTNVKDIKTFDDANDYIKKFFDKPIEDLKLIVGADLKPLLKDEDYKKLLEDEAEFRLKLNADVNAELSKRNNEEQDKASKEIEKVYRDQQQLAIKSIEDTKKAQQAITQGLFGVDKPQLGDTNDALNLTHLPESLGHLAALDAAKETNSEDHVKSTLPAEIEKLYRDILNPQISALQAQGELRNLYSSRDDVPNKDTLEGKQLEALVGEIKTFKDEVAKGNDIQKATEAAAKALGESKIPELNNLVKPTAPDPVKVIQDDINKLENLGKSTDDLRRKLEQAPQVLPNTSVPGPNALGPPVSINKTINNDVRLNVTTNQQVDAKTIAAMLPPLLPGMLDNLEYRGLYSPRAQG